jgi:hypothetical protein
MSEPFAMPHANYMLSILQGPPRLNSFRQDEVKRGVGGSDWPGLACLLQATCSFGAWPGCWQGCWQGQRAGQCLDSCASQLPQLKQGAMCDGHKQREAQLACLPALHQQSLHLRLTCTA